MKRAYSFLTVKTVDEDRRIIEGIATTPTPDRMGDIVEPLGVKFKNPLPLLHQHRADEPVGTVRFDKPTKDGITFRASIPKIEEPPSLKDRVDTAWSEVKHGLVRGASIGFRDLEFSRLDDGGIRFIETEVLELSLVTIPANADCTFQTLKSIDASLQVATDHEPEGIDKTPPAPRQRSTVVKALEGKTMAKTTAERISAFEATRQAKAARMEEIMNASDESGSTLDEEQTQEYDGLRDEVKSIDDHLVRLREMETLNLSKAIVVKGADPAEAAQTRSHSSVIVMPKKLPPGTAFTRYVLALTRAQGNIMQAESIAKGNPQWMTETPEVAEILKTAVNAGTTTDATWAGPLVVYQNMTSEFIEYLRPKTILGRIPGLRRVPFKIKIPRQTGAASVNWVGEGKVKPLTSMAFDTITMEFSKIAGIIPLTEELVRFSSPSAEALVREELANAIIQFMDSQFVDPTKAANDVSPASITNGVTPTTATGTTAAALRADVKTLVTGFLTTNQSLAGLVWLMTESQALAIGMMQNSLGQPVFPSITEDGGTFLGRPVVTSENIPATGGSPTDGGLIILAKASDILLADDGQVTIDASREASLQMETSPDSPATASTSLVSLWQHNMVAIKAERYINWAKARSTSVAFIQSAKYAE